MYICIYIRIYIYIYKYIYIQRERAMLRNGYCCIEPVCTRWRGSCASSFLNFKHGSRDNR